MSIAFGLSFYYGNNFDLSLNHSYNSIKLNDKFAHGRRLFGSSLFQIDEKQRAYNEMFKALDHIQIFMDNGEHILNCGDLIFLIIIDEAKSILKS